MNSEPRPYTAGEDYKFCYVDRVVVMEPGLFIYSGFGWGNYYSSDGRIHWSDTSRARARAKDEGVDYRSHDALAGYVGTYLGD